MNTKRIPLANRLWSKVVCNITNHCWEWQGTINNKRYGHIGRGGKRGQQIYVHRVSWELINGPIPVGLNVLHRCDNPKCVRPDHLFLGSVADNNHDMMNKGRHASAHGTDYLARGSRHGNAKLTEDAVVQIHKLAKNTTQKAIAQRFNVSRRTIKGILSGRAWTHVPKQSA